MPLYRRTKNKSKGKEAAQKALLPWGYAATKKDTIPLLEFVDIITAEDPKDSPSTPESKNCLLYWDRRSLDGRDEAKMIELEIDTNKHFAYVIDVQQWFRDRYPKGFSGKEKHNLGEAADMVGVAYTTQNELEGQSEVQRGRNEAAVRHCAGGDSHITLCVNVEAILQCIHGLEAAEGRTRKIRDDFCFIAIDFEAGGKIGRGTTEGGVSKLFSSDLFDYMEKYALKIETRHAIVREMFDDHIDRKAQDGKIAIENRKKATYPRSNFRGPNTTKKLEYEHHKHDRCVSEMFSISVDSEMIPMHEMQWWIIHQLPVFSEHYIAQVTSEKAPKHSSSGEGGSWLGSQIPLTPSNGPSVFSSTSSTTIEHFNDTPIPAADDKTTAEAAIPESTDYSTPTLNVHTTGALCRGLKGVAPHAKYCIKASKNVPPHIRYGNKFQQAIPPHRRVYGITDAA
ncbi:hypothetical protein D6D01_10176 [Aureobasidium pullulans]|uniref:Uncharacterized protein n=1 Tax=Aureobasidium pullulans TaxID=5580 RepID=A0A4S9JQD4_AURPU|nr:hypothetical protein D6D01_10176 [Aureobasidium pullulans]